MLSSELKASERRLAERTKAAAEKARNKLEKERIIEERRRAREQAFEEEKRRLRLEQQNQQVKQEEERQQEIENNKGVFYRSTLMAVPAPESIAINKGIKRHADKVLLPPSAGRSLLDQNASKNGAYFFELESQTTGRKTFAGLLEFTAAEGFIALPHKAIRCLYGPDSTDTACEGGNINVAYRRLPKGTKVVFQPRSSTFQSAVGDDLRDVLESALAQHSCLSVGDWIRVQLGNGGESYELRVRELEPADAVSVIDTEMEAEVHPSVETEEKILEEELAAMKRRALLAKLSEEAAAAKAEEIAREEEKQVQREKIQKEKEEGLPAEPAVVDDSVMSCLFRFPDGSRYPRKFYKDDSANVLFDFVDSKGASGFEFGGYRLVTQYPRRVIERSKGGVDDEKKVFDVFDGDKEMSMNRVVLFLEPVS